MEIKFLIFLSIFIACVFATPIKNAKDQAIYRLPNTVVPSEYTVNLTLKEDAFFMKKFLGEVSIKIKAVQSTSEIKLHAQRMLIIHVGLKQDKTSLEVTKQNLNEVTDILTLTLAKNLTTNTEYVLSFSYVGTLGDDDMYGFYQSTYKDADGVTHYVASTQFEQTYARRALPCFDEPKLKANFTVSITCEEGKSVLHNTPQVGETKLDNGLVKKTFQTTPKMSTYLLAFIVSDFTPVQNLGGMVTMWARPGTENYRSLAIRYAPKLIEEMSAWTQVPYKSHGVNQMYIVAIPDFAAGAMENWGCVTYRERLLIDEGDDTSVSDRMNIATVIAHEFSHSWFGDLVTLDWWSNTWLNEGFATYFEYHLTHIVEPRFELDKKFVSTFLQPIMQTDALLSASPLSSNEEDVNTPAEADDKFSYISYHKGGSVIRMLREIVSETLFQEGLQAYLKENSYNNTNPKILLSYFKSILLKSPTNLPDTVENIMKNWIYKPGFPLVTVKSSSDGKVVLTQERFLYDSSQSNNTEWYVPISYVTESNPSSPNLVWLKPNETLEIKHNTSEWIIVNYKQMGYYRVNYDKSLWLNLFKSLNDTNTLESIDELNRAQIVDDMLNLARAGKINYKDVFEFMPYLKNEKSYYVWNRVFDGFSFILKKFANTELYGKLSDKILGYMNGLLASVPIKTVDRTQYVYTMKQVLAWTWACKLNHSECINISMNLFKNYKENNQKPFSDFKGFVYCTALQNSPDESNWNFLWNEYTKSTSSAEQVTLLSALGCTRNETIIDKYLLKTLKDNRIRKQDATTAFMSVFKNHPENVPIAYKFLKDNIDDVITYYKDMSSLSTILSAFAETFDEDDISNLKSFMSEKSLSQEFTIAANQAIEKAEANVKWGKTYKHELFGLFGLTSGAFRIATSSYILVVTLILSFATIF